MAKKKRRPSDQTISPWKRSRWVEWYWLPRTVGPIKHHNLDFCVVEIRWLCFSWSKSTQWNENQDHWGEDY